MPNGEWRYRYTLSRCVRTDVEGRVCFIMLNPSTANHNDDDPTIRRCIAYARSWGFGILDVGNLYAYRSTSPRELPTNEACAIGPANNSELLDLANSATKIVLAWGAMSRAKARGQAVIELFRQHGFVSKLHVLRKTADGSPAHPLYLPKNLEPKFFLEPKSEFKLTGGARHVDCDCSDCRPWTT